MEENKEIMFLHGSSFYVACLFFLRALPLSFFSTLDASLFACLVGGRYMRYTEKDLLFCSLDLTLRIFLIKQLRVKTSYCQYVIEEGIY